MVDSTGDRTAGKTPVAARRKPAFPRAAPSAPFLAAMEALMLEMEEAAADLVEAEDFGRAAVRKAVFACYSFLHVSGLSGQGLRPLSLLIDALDHVNEGKLTEILDPAVKPGALPPGKWSRSPQAAVTRVYAAACMEALMTQGNMPKADAAARVARAAQGWPRMSRGVIKPSTVINWRDTFLQAAKSDPQRHRFEATVRSFGPAGDPTKYLDEVLAKGPPLTGAVRPKHRNPRIESMRPLPDASLVLPIMEVRDEGRPGAFFRRRRKRRQ